MFDGGLTIILGFLRKYWAYILVAAATTALLGYVYYLGGTGPRAELAKEIAAREAAEALFDEQEEMHEEQRKDAKQDADKELNDGKERINRAWAPLVADLEKSAADADRARAAAEQRMREHGQRQAAQPVQGPAGCPDGRAGADGLPDAVERYIAAERSREERERADASRLFQSCQQQAGKLTNARDWARRLQGINAR